MLKNKGLSVIPFQEAQVPFIFPVNARKAGEGNAVQRPQTASISISFA
jgi:hypothetical protein